MFFKLPKFLTCAAEAQTSFDKTHLREGRIIDYYVNICCNRARPPEPILSSRALAQAGNYVKKVKGIHVYFFRRNS